MFWTRATRKIVDMECDGVLLTVVAVADSVAQSLCSAFDAFVARGKCSAGRIPRDHPVILGSSQQNLTVTPDLS